MRIYSLLTAFQSHENVITLNRISKSYMRIYSISMGFQSLIREDIHSQQDPYAKRFMKDEKITKTAYIANSGGLLGLCMGFRQCPHQTTLNVHFAKYLFLFFSVLCRPPRFFTIVSLVSSGKMMMIMRMMMMMMMIVTILLYDIDFSLLQYLLSQFSDVTHPQV